MLILFCHNSGNCRQHWILL